MSYLSDCWEITCVCVKARQKLILLVAMVSSESSDSQSLWSGGNVIFTVEWRGCCPGPQLVLMEATEDRLWASWIPKAEKATLPFYLYGEAHKGYVSPLRALEYQRLCAEREVNLGITLLPPGKKRMICEHIRVVADIRDHMVLLFNIDSTVLVVRRLRFHSVCQP